MPCPAPAGGETRALASPGPTVSVSPRRIERLPDIEIGMGKSARRAYSLDEVSLVPTRRTREAEKVDLAWDIDAFHFEAPVLAAPNDAISSPATAALLAEVGG